MICSLCKYQHAYPDKEYVRIQKGDGYFYCIEKEEDDRNKAYSLRDETLDCDCCSCCDCSCSDQLSELRYKNLIEVGYYKNEPDNQDTSE